MQAGVAESWNNSEAELGGLCATTPEPIMMSTERN